MRNIWLIIAGLLFSAALSASNIYEIKEHDSLEQMLSFIRSYETAKVSAFLTENVPDEISSLKDLQRYAAVYSFYAESYSPPLKKNSGVTSQDGYWLRLTKDLSPSLERIEELFAYAREIARPVNLVGAKNKVVAAYQDVGIIDYESSTIYSFLIPHPGNKAEIIADFQNYLMVNNEDLLPNYAGIISSFLSQMAAAQDEANRYINSLKTISTGELSSWLSIKNLTDYDKEELITKMSRINNDFDRIGNVLRALSNNIDSLQLLDLYMLAEQSFYYLSILEKSAKEVIDGGSFMPSDRPTTMGPIPHIEKFFHCRYFPMRLLYLTSVVMARSLFDFANNFRAQAGLEPISDEIFIQGEWLKKALVLNEDLPTLDEYIAQKKERRKNKRIDKKAKNKPKKNLSRGQKKAAKKRRKQNQRNERKMSLKDPAPKRSLLDKESAQKTPASFSLAPIRQSIGSKVYQLLSIEERQACDQLFGLANESLRPLGAQKLLTEVFKALIDINKVDRAAKFLKFTSDSATFPSQSSQEEFLTQESMERILLPFISLKIIPPSFTKKEMVELARSFAWRRFDDEAQNQMKGGHANVNNLINLLEQNEAIIESADDDGKGLLLVNLANSWHGLAISLEKSSLANKSKLFNDPRRQNIDIKIVEILNKALPYFETGSSEIGMLEANLFSYYLKKDFAPAYEPLSGEEYAEIKENVYISMLNGPDKVNRNSVDIIDENGIFIEKYEIADSPYHLVTNNSLGDCVIIKLSRHLHERELEPFIRYKGQIYRTDVLGGSLLKAKPSEGNFGSLIGVSLRAGDFFAQWFTSEEAFWYGRRAFLPNYSRKKTKSIKRIFSVQTIPDNWEYAVKNHIISQDGFGFIRESALAGLKLHDPKRGAPRRPQKVTYQALQAYDHRGHRQAVEELVRGSFDAQDPHLGPKEAANAALPSLPKLSGLGIPVSGDKVVLPNDERWREFAKAGLLLGRSPYSSAKRMQRIRPENIEYSDELLNEKVFQYTLTGIKENGAASFFKGLFKVIPDDDWPKEFANADILAPSKDEKLEDSRINAEMKEAAQHTEASFYLAAVLVMIQDYARQYIVGLPLTLAQDLAGDYDGDTYDFMQVAGFWALADLIEKESMTAIKNPKIKKTFTPRTTVGNWQRILSLRHHLLENWVTIANRFYYLSPQYRALFIEDIADGHRLRHWLGLSWNRDLGIDKSSLADVITAEIQVGMKLGEDMFKSSVDHVSLKARAHEYFRALNRYQKNQLIPYGDGLKQLSLEEAFEAALDAKSSSNLLHKACRAKRRLESGCEFKACVSEDEDEVLTY